MEPIMSTSIFRLASGDCVQEELGPTDVQVLFEAAPPCAPNDNFLTSLQIPAEIGQIYCGMKVGSTACHASHALPIYDIDGALSNGLFLKQNAQGIFEEIFVPGAPFSGRFARLSHRTKKILVTESYAFAQRLHHATKCCVVVTFFAENITDVCTILASKYPDAELVVVGEMDKSTDSQRSLTTTINAAAEVGLPFASLEAIDGTKDDVELYKVAMRTAIENASFIPKVQHIRSTSAIFEHDDPIPWSRPLNGNALIENVVVVIAKYVVLPPHAILTVALWVFFTYLVDAFNIAPILALCSPEKRCGKTTVEELVGEIAHRPKMMSNITPAGFYQAIDDSCATMIIDECDTFLFPSQQLIGMINSGYKRKGGKVVRGGRDNKSNTYNLFGPKVLAMIGPAPESIEDRSLVIWLRRKKPSEVVSRLSDAAEGDFIALRSQISRWAADNMNNVRNAKPALPNLSSDRAIDNWLPLLTIATCISPECLELATAAAYTLYESQTDDSMSIGEELLFDIRSVFLNHCSERISTKTLIAGLCSNRERPWASFDNRNPISARQLSTFLAKYGVRSKNIRINDDVFKGYELPQFKDAFERYLSVDDAPQ